LRRLGSKNAEIDNFNLLLSQERNRDDNHRNERDQAVAEHAEVFATLSNIHAMLEKTEIPMPLRRKRNGNVVGNGNVAPDNVVADIDGEQLANGGGRKPSTERQLSVADPGRATLAP
jgi:hypothetical protein